jgi:hypothetical protein
MNPGIDLSCAKKIIIGDPKPMDCPGNEEKDAGLCYKKCDKGFDGVGPVCWSIPPRGWVNCGFGSAVDSWTCAEAVKDQVLSVGELALFIASLGTSSAAKYPASLEGDFDDLLEQTKELADTFFEVADILRGESDPNTGAIFYDIVFNTGYAPEMEPEDKVRVAAELASLLDPTGISSIIAAYTYPTCDKIE